MRMPTHHSRQISLIGAVAAHIEDSNENSWENVEEALHKIEHYYTYHADRHWLRVNNSVYVSDSGIEYEYVGEIDRLPDIATELETVYSRFTGMDHL